MNNSIELSFSSTNPFPQQCNSSTNTPCAQSNDLKKINKNETPRVFSSEMDRSIRDNKFLSSTEISSSKPIMIEKNASEPLSMTGPSDASNAIKLRVGSDKNTSIKPKVPTNPSSSSGYGRSRHEPINKSRDVMGEKSFKTNIVGFGVPIENKMIQDDEKKEYIEKVKTPLQRSLQAGKASKNNLQNVLLLPPHPPKSPCTTHPSQQPNKMISHDVPSITTAPDGLISLTHKSNTIASGANSESLNEPSSNVSLCKEQSKPNVTKEDIKQDPQLTKYVKMALVGVPPQSVVHKMTADDISKEKIKSFETAYGLIPSSGEAENKARTTTKEKQREPNVTKEDINQDPQLTKYVKMTSVGVPPQSVVHKMTADGVPKDKIESFERAYGLRSILEGNQKGLETKQKLPIPPSGTPGQRRTSVTMQKIHWRAVAEEKVKDSLWGKSFNERDGEIDQAEIEQIENLFGAKRISNANGKKQNITNTKELKKEVRLIELKRANNIAISLAQYRSFDSYEELCEAVVKQDRSNLCAGKLQNMQSLLPTADELKIMKRHKDGIEGLGRAELFFFAVSKIPRFGQKLDAFLFSLQFADFVQEFQQSIELLEKACTEIVTNRKLAGILRRILAVGNLMNEGAGKPMAPGITVDSLLKTANKKGSDGKTSVLDHVIGTFLKQGDEDSISLWDEMACVREATRIDIRELKNTFRDLNCGVKKVNTSIEIENKMLEQNTSVKCINVFLQKSQDFLVDATKQIKRMEINLKAVEQSVHSLCCFFAEDSMTCQVRLKEQFFILDGLYVPYTTEIFLDHFHPACKCFQLVME